MSASARVLVSIGGGAFTSGGVFAAFTQSVALSAASTVGWTSAIWELYDYPSGFSTPAGWTLAPTGVIYYQPSNPTTPPPSFNLPASGSNNWGKWAIRLRINGNPVQPNADGSPNTSFNAAYTDTSTAVCVRSPVAGMDGVFLGETTQFDAFRQAIGELMQSLRALDAGGGGGGFTPGGDLGGTSTVQTVLALTGIANVIAMHGNKILADQGVTVPTLAQAQQANAAAPQSWHWAPQPPGAAATNATNGTPGSAFIDFAQPVTGGAEAMLQATRAVSGTPTNIWSLETTAGGAGLLRLSNLAGGSFDSTIANLGPQLAVITPSSGLTFSMNGVGGSLVLFSQNDGIRVSSPLKGMAIGASADYSNGSGVLAMQNAGTAPTSAPTGGFILYGDSGNVAYRTSSNFQLDLPTATATSATSGTQTLPGLPAGFLVASLGGTTIKIPYYNP
jgi:hypothetical protein